MVLASAKTSKVLRFCLGEAALIGKRDESGDDLLRTQVRCCCDGVLWPIGNGRAWFEC